MHAIYTAIEGFWTNVTSPILGPLFVLGLIFISIAWRWRSLNRALMVACGSLGLLCVAASNVGLPFAINNTMLKKLPSTQYLAVWRLGFANIEDTYPMQYNSSNSTCSLASGNGDNGSQSKSADNKCWLAQFPPTGASPSEWGADRTGATDSAAAFQLAANALVGGIISIGQGEIFKLSSGVTLNMVTIQGPANSNPGFPASNCTTSGIIAGTTNLNLLTFTTQNGGGIKDLCISMGATPGLNTSGAAITLLESTQFIERATIFNPFVGIDLGGNTNWLDKVLVAGVDGDGSVGIRVGYYSYNGNTIDPTILNTTVAGVYGSLHPCYADLEILDAGGLQDGPNNDFLYCKYGTAPVPQSAQIAAFTGAIDNSLAPQYGRLAVSTITSGIVSQAAIVSGGTGYGANKTGTMTWSGSGCVTNPVLNVTTNAGGVINAVTGIASGTYPGPAGSVVSSAGGAYCATYPGRTATTWTVGGGLSAGSGAQFGLLPFDSSQTQALGGTSIQAGQGLLGTTTGCTGGSIACYAVKYPQTISSEAMTLWARQAINGNGIGNFDGDTNTLSGMYFNPQGIGATISDLQYTDCQASGNGGTSHGIDLENTNGGYVSGIHFKGCKAIGNGLSGFYVGTGISDWAIQDSWACGNNNQGSTGDGITLASGASNGIITGTTAQNTCLGLYTESVQRNNIGLVGSNTSLVIAANNFSANGGENAFGGTPAATTSGTSIVLNNNGVDTYIPPAIASASSITLFAEPIEVISGTAAINTMLGWWISRQVTILPSGAFSFVTGGGSGGQGAICNAITAIVNVPIIGQYDAGNGCWHLLTNSPGALGNVTALSVNVTGTSVPATAGIYHDSADAAGTLGFAAGGTKEGFLSPGGYLVLLGGLAGAGSNVATLQLNGSPTVTPQFNLSQTNSGNITQGAVRNLGTGAGTYAALGAITGTTNSFGIFECQDALECDIVTGSANVNGLHIIVGAGGLFETGLASTSSPQNTYECINNGTHQHYESSVPCIAGYSLVGSGTQSFSGSVAFLAWTGLTANEYDIRCYGLVSSATAADAWGIQFGEGGSPTWKTSGYQRAYFGFKASGSADNQGSTSDSQINFGANANTTPFVLTAHLHGLTTAISHSVEGNSQGINGYNSYSFGGTYTSDTTAITAARIIDSTGNPVSGTCSLYALGN